MSRFTRSLYRWTSAADGSSGYSMVRLQARIVVCDSMQKPAAERECRACKTRSRRSSMNVRNRVAFGSPLRYPPAFSFLAGEYLR